MLKNSRRSLMTQNRWNALTITTIDHNALKKRYTFQRYSQGLKKFKSQYFKLKKIVNLKFRFTFHNVLFLIFILLDTAEIIKTVITLFPESEWVFFF